MKIIEGDRQENLSTQFYSNAPCPHQQRVFSSIFTLFISCLVICNSTFNLKFLDD